MRPVVEGLRVRYDRLVRLLGGISLPALRVALGLVFAWFDAMKVVGLSPVAELVLETVPFFEAPAWIVPVMGVFEVGVGFWLIAGIGLRLLLPVYVAHLLATLGVLVQPAVAFQNGNPLLLTSEGEFVIKNLVLLAAGIAVCARARRVATSGETTTGTRDPHALMA